MRQDPSARDADPRDADAMEHIPISSSSPPSSPPAAAAHPDTMHDPTNAVMEEHLERSTLPVAVPPRANGAEQALEQGPTTAVDAAVAPPSPSLTPSPTGAADDVHSLMVAFSASVIAAMAFAFCLRAHARAARGGAGSPFGSKGGRRARKTYSKVVVDEEEDEEDGSTGEDEEAATARFDDSCSATSDDGDTPASTNAPMLARRQCVGRVPRGKGSSKASPPTRQTSRATALPASPARAQRSSAPGSPRSPAMRASPKAKVSKDHASPPDKGVGHEAPWNEQGMERVSRESRASDDSVRMI